MHVGTDTVERMIRRTEKQKLVQGSGIYLPWVKVVILS